MRAAIPLAVLLVACNKVAPQPDNDVKAAATSKAATPASKPFAYDEKNDLIDFHFGWSAEAAAVPQLVQRFRAQMDKIKVELLANAKADKAEREKQGFPFNEYSSSTDYNSVGSTTRLLSLQMDVAAYTGGAHGNYGTIGLLWDRREAREIQLADLFATAANMDRLLTQPWCDALNKAREEKRGEAVGDGGMFDECPKLTEVAIIPSDKNRSGRFELLTLVADPYVAGPYSEGSYEIELPITSDLMAAVRSEYRESFEAQPQ